MNANHPHKTQPPTNVYREERTMTLFGIYPCSAILNICQGDQKFKKGFDTKQNERRWLSYFDF